MKLHLKSLTAVSLLLLASSSIYAASDVAANESVRSLNSISIINGTDKDVVYRFLSTSAANMYYGVKHGKSAKYHTKPGDKHTTVEIGECKHFNSLTGLCLSFDSKNIKNCVGNTYYNADKVDSITINSLSSCTVKCTDGSSSSCISE